MKRIILSIITLLTICNCSTIAQTKGSLDGFKYAVVAPVISINNERDIHGMEAKAIEGLQKAGFICLNPLDRNKWVEEAALEPCKVIFIYLSEGRLPNALNCGAIRIVGKNCKG
jgi:uncharacterized protein YceK